MSPLDPEIAPVGEEVHLPGPSLIPVLTALGIAMLLVGITISKFLLVGGAVLTFFCVVRWIRDTRRDMDELPLG